MRTGAKTRPAQLELVKPHKPAGTQHLLSTIDLFSGGGITEEFRTAGHACLDANDSMPQGKQPLQHNHPKDWADCCRIEHAEPIEIRSHLRLAKGELTSWPAAPREILDPVPVARIRRILDRAGDVK